jgi:hypothetical protein
MMGDAAWGHAAYRRNAVGQNAVVGHEGAEAGREPEACPQAGIRARGRRRLGVGYGSPLSLYMLLFNPWNRVGLRK